MRMRPGHLIIGKHLCLKGLATLTASRYRRPWLYDVTITCNICCKTIASAEKEHIVRAYVIVSKHFKRHHPREWGKVYGELKGKPTPARSHGTGLLLKRARGSPEGEGWIEFEIDLEEIRNTPPDL